MMKAVRDFITRYATDWIFLALVNFNNKLKSRVGVVSRFDQDLYVVDDGRRKVYTPRRSRLGRYFFGIDKQSNILAETYLLHNAPVSSGDVLIDCGANNGEIGIWAQNNGMNYYAFEPEPLESRCCDLNNFGGEAKTQRKGLWHEVTTLHWYSKPETADSSLIEMEASDDVQSIDVTTLADFVAEQGIERIRIFKLEAEGAEPEVLQGALPVLDKIDYVAVDCGYERGIEKNHTFMEVYQTLTAHGFDIVQAQFKRTIFLFKRDGV